MLQVAYYIKGGWIQSLKPSVYKFPDSQRALEDAIKAAGPNLGPVLLSMSEYLMSSFNESYQSRHVGALIEIQISHLIVLCLFHSVILL